MIWGWGGGGPTVERLGGKLIGQITSHREATCFSICERRPPSAREILLCAERRTDHKRVLKNNDIFEYPWNLVQWENARRVSLKKNQLVRK